MILRVVSLQYDIVQVYRIMFEVHSMIFEVDILRLWFFNITLSIYDINPLKWYCKSNVLHIHNTNRLKDSSSIYEMAIKLTYWITVFLCLPHMNQRFNWFNSAALCDSDFIDVYVAERRVQLPWI